jgi:hypothetical protein
MNKKNRNLMGQTFGRLEVVNVETPDPKTKNRRWLCKCSCGNLKPVWESALLRKHTKSCGCLHRFKEGEFAINNVISSYSRGATKRGLSWELSKEQALTIMSKNCWFCDSVPQNCSRSATGNFFYNGIDRLDNTVGYVYSNCVACCKVCNFMKRAMSVEGFFAHLKKILGRHKNETSG